MHKSRSALASAPPKTRGASTRGPSGPSASLARNTGFGTAATTASGSPAYATSAHKHIKHIGGGPSNLGPVMSSGSPTISQLMSGGRTGGASGRMYNPFSSYNTREGDNHSLTKTSPEPSIEKGDSGFRSSTKGRPISKALNSKGPGERDQAAEKHKNQRELRSENSDDNVVGESFSPISPTSQHLINDEVSTDFAPSSLDPFNSLH